MKRVGTNWMTKQNMTTTLLGKNYKDFVDIDIFI